MLFILSVIIAIVAFIAWRAAARKVKENNLSFRALATLGAARVRFLYRRCAFAVLHPDPCRTCGRRGLLWYRVQIRPCLRASM